MDKRRKTMNKIIFIFSLCIFCVQFHIWSAELPKLTHSISSHTPLTRAFPGLVCKLPHIALGDLPTPVQHLKKCGDVLHLQHLYIKRDDLSGKKNDDGSHLFGGNKVRKLEFFLADALNHDAQTVLTFGCAGSNHVVATATYAQFLGLSCIAMLKPQPNSLFVQRNLLLMGAAQAELHYSSHEDRPRATELTVNAYQKKHGVAPYQIPTGGSCAWGVIGFASAVFELAEQIERGEILHPDFLYVAAGSCGTIAGLMLGAKAAGLHTKIIGVCVEPEEVPGEFREKIMGLVHETSMMLHSLDVNFPLFEIDPDEITLVHDMCGTGYGEPFEPAQQAIEFLAHAEKIQLDGTYTGKAFSALVRDAQDNRLPMDAVVLFWHSYCGSEISSLYSSHDYHQLPAALWAYFENESVVEL
jgi:1-aminocyclopropane-1-carboxylate deaminase/D-cysteine desulfhydrase-like pyridoxal-dependent ACC family enzyme